VGSKAVIRPEDIGSLTDFSRNTKAHLKRLKKTGRPELLTVNGKAEVVVQNASAYQRLIESLEKLKRQFAEMKRQIGIG
jgi:PHD/YefM family antitoxin component YafN of YafNO toxin-antitoxin module